MASRKRTLADDFRDAEAAIDYSKIVGDPDGETATTVGDMPEQTAQYRANYAAKVARDAARAAAGTEG